MRANNFTSWAHMCVLIFLGRYLCGLTSSLFVLGRVNLVARTKSPTNCAVAAQMPEYINGCSADFTLQDEYLTPRHRTDGSLGRLVGATSTLNSTHQGFHAGSLSTVGNRATQSLPCLNSCFSFFLSFFLFNGGFIIGNDYVPRWWARAFAREGTEAAPRALAC